MQFHSTLLWGVLPVTAVVVACSGAKEPSSEVNLDASVVKTQASALTTAISAADSGNGVNVAAEVAAIGNAGAALIPRTRGASRAQVRGATTSTTCRCTTAAQKTCTFDGCTIAGAVTHGAVSWAGGKLTCVGLTFDVPALGKVQVEGETLTIESTHVEVACDMTYSASTLEGTLRSKGSTTVNDVDYAWDAALTAADIAFTAKAFTAGTVDVNATVTTVSDAEGTSTFHASGAVTFP